MKRSHRRALASAAVLALSTVATATHAEDEPAAEEQKDETEFTPAPLVGGNSDVGVGGGIIASVARLKPGVDPYVYRFELVSATMFKSERGALTVPYQDHYLLLSLPNLMRGRIRLDIRASYTREATLKYYGIGNAAHIPNSRALDDPLYEYERTHPTLSVKARMPVVGHLSLYSWLSYTQNSLKVRDDTLLARDGRSPNPAIREMVSTFEPHGVATFSYGVDFDTRNDEVSSTRGQYHALRVDLSPGGVAPFPQRWGRSNAAARWFFPLGDDGSAVAARLVGDALFGDAPVYELARFDETGAFGGPNGVRGVPGQRYHGMVKVFSNLELRKMLFHFRFLGKNNGLEMAVFVDAGRLWATYRSHPELDGTGVGLKVGIGGGPRLVAGKSFVLRGDVAWSPDARPLGAYLAAGHVF